MLRTTPKRSEFVSSAVLPVQSVAGVAVEEEFARVRTALVNSITTSCSPNIGETRIKLPTPKPGAELTLRPPTSRIVDSILPIKAPWNRAFAHCAPVFDKRFRGLQQRSSSWPPWMKLWTRYLCVRERQLALNGAFAARKTFRATAQGASTAACLTLGRQMPRPCGCRQGVAGGLLQGIAGGAARRIGSSVAADSRAHRSIEERGKQA
jgi:hypothetical protein